MSSTWDCGVLNVGNRIIFLCPVQISKLLKFFRLFWVISKFWQSNLSCLLKGPNNTEVSTATCAVGTGIEPLCVWFGQWTVALTRNSLQSWNAKYLLASMQIFWANSDSWRLKRNDAANTVEVNGSNKWKCEQWAVAGSRVFSAQFAGCEQRRCIELGAGAYWGHSRNQVGGKQAEVWFGFFFLISLAHAGRITYGC